MAYRNRVIKINDQYGIHYEVQFNINGRDWLTFAIYENEESAIERAKRDIAREQEETNIETIAEFSIDN